jgi:flagellar M-ring protein FliF
MGPGSPFAPYLDRWNQLPRSRQFALIGIGAIAVVAIYMVFLNSTSPNLVVAYSGLAPEDSAAIADHLENEGIPYEIGAGGSTVSVPANQVAEVRIQLAQQNLPAGGTVGMELFDKTDFGATDFNNQVNYQRALEGELARSINTLDGVRGSRVHLVMPEEAIFVEDQEAASASVLLQLDRGAGLTQDQIRGITNLVVNSVQGLTQEHVTIIDETGRALYDGAAMSGDFGFGGTSTQMELQRAYELSLQRDLEQTLAQVVGVGRSAVTVRAVLDFDEVTETETQFADAGQAVPRSSVSVQETFNGNGLTVGGVPGTGANGADIAADDAATGNSQYTRTETTVNNEISSTTSVTNRAPGQVERLSVSVVLDESVTAAQETAITSAVAAAVAFDQVRGDTLSVTRIPFDASVRDALVAPAGDGLAEYLDYLKLVIPFMAIILAFVLVMLLLRSLSSRQLALPAFAQPRVLSEPAYMPSLASASAPMPELEPGRDPHESRVLSLADQNPRAVADVVQTWMREEG